MIKGTVILAVGFGLGYATAVSQVPEVKGAAVAFRQFMEDIALAEDIKKRQAADEAAGAEPVAEAEVVEADEEETPAS